MTQQQVATVSVGDVVIVVRSYGAKPETDNIAKVTPKGAVRINSKEEILFKPSWNGVYESSEKIFRGWKLYLNTPENMTKLTEEYEKKEEYKRAKEAAEQERVQKINQQHQSELEQVKTLLDNKLPVLSKMVPDYNMDETIYILDIPVKPELVDRKGSHEILIVKVKKETSWRDESTLRGYFTYTNKRTDSFPSVSGFDGNNAEDIVWECVKSAYFSW